MFVVICLTISTFGIVYSQEEANPNLSSPNAAIFNHISNLEEDNYNPEIAAKSFLPEKYKEEEAIDLAIKLYQVYRGTGMALDFDEIPRQQNYYDSVAQSHKYVIDKDHPKIFLIRKNNNWYYSDVTAKSIESLHKKVYPFGTDKLLHLLPKLGTKMVLGLHLWQFIGLLILVIACVIIHKIFTLIIERIFLGLLIRRGYKTIAKKYIAPIAKPASILILFPILLIFVPVLQLPFKVNNFILLALKGLWPVFATILFYKFADLLGVYMQRFAEKTETTLDDHLVPLVRKALKIFVVIIGALAILANLKVNIIPLLTGLSIGGLAFALAAQDTLKNFFGSLMIFLDRPFQIGDWITSGNIDGTVEEVGFRATRVRTFRNSLVYVPNGYIADSTVDNHGLREYRRFYTHIAINYDTPSNVINVFVEGLRAIVENHPFTRKDNYHVYLNDMADSSLNVMFYIFFKVPTWGEELRCRHEILIEIIKLAEELGVSFAFPTRTLHMESFPEKKSNSPEYEKSTPMLKSKLESYLEKDKDWGPDKPDK
jgi:MscS family membrane protein